MNRPLVLSMAAELDLKEARDWYDVQRPALGDNLMNEVSQFFERIESNPERYGYIQMPIRKVALTIFPYVLYYEVLGEMVFVHAVHHPSREPRLYTSRQ